MENYLYFAESSVITGGGFASGGSNEAVMLPASSYLYADPSGNTTTDFFFKNLEETDYGMCRVRLTHDGGENKEVIKAVLSCMNANPSEGGFIVVADMNVINLSNPGPVITGALVPHNVVTVTILQDVTGGLHSTLIAGDSGGTTTYNSYGAGAISTSSAPQYRRQVKGTDVITDILVDLTGLQAKGDAANDVIGLAAGGAAYIAKYVQSEMGILYNIEVFCTEIPGEGTATITTDIDINFNASATLAYDSAAGTSEINTGGFAAVGGKINQALSATADDYIYLTEGDNAATTGEYNAGKIIIRLTGSTATF